MHNIYQKAVRLLRLSIVLPMGTSLVLAGMAVQSVAAACPSLPTPNGMVTQTFSIPTTGNYVIWSRINAPDTSANSYYLEIDDSTCGVVVGDNAISANTWTWVNHRDGNTNSKITVNLTAGNHTMRMIGRETGVKLDRVVLTTDVACTPTGLGDNCASPPTDTTPPTVAVTAPSGGQTLSGTTAINVNASDNQSVSRVEFFVDNQLIQVDTIAPYTYNWDTTTVSNGTHNLTAKAYDPDNNSATSAGVSITVSNQAPTPPPPPPAPSFRAEDINQDGKVNLLDFSLLASKYGQTTNLGRTDINNDGRVNLLDFSLLASKYGT